MTAYLVDLGHKVGGLLCRVPNLTQCESNDCIRHSMHQYVNSEAPKQHSHAPVLLPSCHNILVTGTGVAGSLQSMQKTASSAQGLLDALIATK